MFSKGQRRITVTGGWGQSFGTDYLLLGIGIGYYLANGLDIGLDFEGWLLGDPTVYKLSPRVDYVMWRSPKLKPYAGAFYRRNWISGGFDDLNSLGGRAGAFCGSNRGAPANQRAALSGASRDAAAPASRRTAMESTSPWRADHSTWCARA